MPFWASQPSLTILQWVLRAVVMFFWMFMLSKIQGQRSLGQLHVFDFIMAIVIAGITAGVLNSSRNALMGALVTTGAITLLNFTVCHLELKNAKLRRLVQDEPLVLIQNGRLIEDTMRKARINLDDLMLELRQKNAPNLHDVEYAILESNGKLSVIPKSQCRPLQPRDLGIPTSYEGMPSMLIHDGNIIERNLSVNGLDKDWLIGQLREHGVDDPKKVIVALLDTGGRLFIGKKGEEYIH